MKTKRYIKSLIAAMLLIVLICSMIPAASADNPFPFNDVKPGKWYYDHVVWAYYNGFTSGTDTNKFSPHKTLSFAEIATFLYCYAYSPTPHYTYADQLSSHSNSYYYTSMNWACDFGVIPIRVVTEGGSPRRALTRDEFVNIMYRYAQLWEHRSVSVSGDYLSKYTDVPSDSVSRQAWNWAVKTGLAVGTSPTTLSPEKTLTRAEFVTVLHRYETQKLMLRGEALINKRLRGWQRTLLETLELAYGVPWQDHAYDIGSNGIPTLIDCSGIVEWAFTYAGIHQTPDLESYQLWASNHFTRVFARKTNSSGGYTETGYQFINRVKGSMMPGDMIFCGQNSSNYHMMVYLDADASYVYVFHSRSGVGACVEKIPNTSNSYYLSNIYGVKRYIP